MSFHINIPAIIFGCVIIGVVLLDAFETVVLPRRVTRQFKLTAWFYRQHLDSVEEALRGASGRHRGSKIFWDISGRCR